MSSLASPELNPACERRERRERLNLTDVRANRAFRWLALIGGILVFFTMIAIVYQIISGASMAIDKEGIAFVAHKSWVASPSANQFGALAFIYGTLMTGIFSVVFATVLGVSIGLFLGLMAPRRVAAIIGPLVEMLAAIPSVVLGLIGIYLICPFIAQDIEPVLHSTLGFLPFFGAAQSVGNSLFAAILVLTIMVVPIVAALTRDLFMTVPRELRDGAEALGATRWEMIRGVVLPTTQSGILASAVLGFGRATGEAIAVTEVIGGITNRPIDLFKEGATIASLLANQFPSPVSALHLSSLYYCALILLILEITTNLIARRITSGFRRR